MNLTTGQAITRGQVEAVPLPAAVKERVEEMALTQGIKNVKFTNRAGVELPNIEDERGTEYTDAYDDYDNYDKDYEQPQQVQEDVDLNVEEENINQDEINDLLANEGQADNNTQRNDDINDDVDSESEPDENNNIVEILENDDENSESDDNDDDNNDDDDDDENLNNKIDGVIDEFEQEVLPGVLEVLPTAETTLRQSTRDKKEIQRLTFVQTQHLETKSI